MTMSRNARDDFASRVLIGRAASDNTISSQSNGSYTVSTCQLAALVMTVHRGFVFCDRGCRSDKKEQTFHVRANVASSRLNSRYQAAPTGSYPAMWKTCRRLTMRDRLVEMFSGSTGRRSCLALLHGVRILLISSTLGSVARIFVTRTWPTETELSGWWDGRHRR